MVKIIVLQDDGSPVGPGLPLELVGDGTVLGKATAGEAGLVCFEVDRPRVKRLAIRLDKEAVLRLEGRANVARDAAR